MKTAKIKHFDILDKEWNSLVDPKTGRVLSRLTEKTDCQVCKAKRWKEAFVKKGLQFVRCDKCSHVFINPRLKQKVLNEHFKKSEAWNIWSKKVLTSGKQAQFDKQKYSKALSLMSRGKLKSGNLKLLDVGCSSGAFLNLARNEGWDVYGVEPSKEAAEFARKNYNLNIHRGDFNSFETKSKFDCITFWASLEYNSDVRKTINKANKLLKKGGLLLIFISGNSHSLVMKMLKEECAGFLFNRTHYFSPESIDALVSRKYTLLKRYSIIPEIEPILRYCSYQKPYDKRVKVDISGRDKKQLFSAIEKYHMGYKFLSIYVKG